MSRLTLDEIDLNMAVNEEFLFSYQLHLEIGQAIYYAVQKFDQQFLKDMIFDYRSIQPLKKLIKCRINE